MRSRAKAFKKEHKYPLHEACDRGRVDIVQTLLMEMDLDINAQRKTDGATALFVAAAYGHSEIVAILLNHLVCSSVL